jgi:ribonuclease R
MKKKKRNIDPFEKKLESFIFSKQFLPMTLDTLLKKLYLKKQEMGTLKKGIEHLTKKGLILFKDGWIKKPEKSETYQGLFHSSKKGFGFVTPHTEALKEDIFIPKNLTLNAMDKDIVEVEVLSKRSKKGPDGKVTKIIQRVNKFLVATIAYKQEQFYQGFVTTLGEEKPVLIQSQIPLEKGDRVYLTIESYGSKNEPIFCTLNKKLGAIDDPSIDVDVAILEYSLRNSFPRECIQEAKRFGNQVDSKEILSRKDLRALTTFTIDPATAKDFDDALSIEKTKDGYVLYVHIADVAHYIKSNSELDQEAKKRCNSTYFPSSVVPMIPFELSNELCSLKPNVDRLCQTIVMHFDHKGQLLKNEIVRSVIHSDCRFTYEQVKEIIDGKKDPFKQHIDHMLELVAFLKEQRRGRGSVEFGVEEAKVIVDEHGAPLRIEVVEYDISHQLVEEFMLKANETVATQLTKNQKQMIYRVHEEPQLADFDTFLNMAAILGYKNEAKDPKSIGHLLNKVQEPSIAKVLALQYIKSLKLAIYSPDNIGHFGLSLEYYCHFTSPIRRYSDLIVQRILFNEHDPNQSLDEIAKLTSEKERNSQKCENSVIFLKKLRLCKKMIEKDPMHPFNAIVTDIKPHGITFEIKELYFSGFIHISKISRDYLEFEPKKQQLIGKRSSFRLALFDRISLIVKELDLIFQRIEWEVIS